jgi:N-methylhydantoinase A/oxoprolinase/acetone carboxylase beta subunit
VDPRDCLLVPFGGGGPLHCCGLAGQLGMTRIFVPPHAGALSALGLAITAERRERLTSVLQLTSDLDGAAVARLLADSATGVAAASGWDRRWIARARYAGQGHELDVPVVQGDDGAAIAERFAAVHRQRNGFLLGAPVELVALRHVASGAPHPVRFARHAGSRWSEDHRVDDGGTFDAELRDGDVVALPGATLRVTAGWRGRPHPSGGWLLERSANG